MLQGLVLATLALLAPTTLGVAVQTAVEAQLAVRGPAPTPAPSLNQARNLFRRDEGATCGYIDGEKDEPVYCPDGFGCFWWPNIPQFSSAPAVGSIGAGNCIPTDYSASDVIKEKWYPATTCKDYNDGKYNTGDGSVVLSQTMYCGSEATKCAQIYFRSAPSDFFASVPASSSLEAAGYAWNYCDSTKTTYTAYLTAS